MRPAVGALGFSGLGDIKEHAWMHVPEWGAACRAVQRQVVSCHHHGLALRVW